MPPKKNLQQTLEEHNEAFRGALAAFQEDLRNTLRVTMEAAIRTALQAQRPGPRLPRREDQVFVDDVEDVVFDDNPFARNHEQQQRAVDVPHRVDNNRWESGFKLDLPEFSGELQADEFLDWLSAVEELVSFKQVPDEKRVPLIATRFRGRASAWWQQFKLQRQNAHKDQIHSWEKLRKHMRKAFLPYNYSRTIYTRLQNLRQGSKSVDDYATEFFSLLARNTLCETEEQTVSRFIGRLRQQLQNTLLQFNPTTVSEAHQRAILIEQNSHAVSPNWSSTNSRSRSLPFDTTKQSDTLPDPGAPPRTSEANDIATAPRIQRAPTFKCFGCGEQGHRQSACPKATRRGLFTDGDAKYDVYAGDQEVQEVEEHLSGDTGPLL